VRECTDPAECQRAKRSAALADTMPGPEDVGIGEGHLERTAGEH